MTTKLEWECEDVTHDNDFLDAPIRLWLRRWQLVNNYDIDASAYYIVEYKDEPDMFYIRYSAQIEDHPTVTYEKHECITGPFGTIEAAQTAAEMLVAMEVEYE